MEEFEDYFTEGVFTVDVKLKKEELKMNDKIGTFLEDVLKGCKDKKKKKSHTITINPVDMDSKKDNEKNYDKKVTPRNEESRIFVEKFFKSLSVKVHPVDMKSKENNEKSYNKVPKPRDEESRLKVIKSFLNEVFKGVPDNAVPIGDKTPPKGARVITGPRGGKYIVPGAKDEDKPKQDKLKDDKVDFEMSLKNRGVKGDKILDAKDMAEELKDVGAKINNDATVTLYHRTTKENKEKILNNKKMFGREDGIFFSTKKDSSQAEGFGDELIKVNVPLERLQLDDLFDDEAHLRVPTKRANEMIDISGWLTKSFSSLSDYIDSIEKVNDTIVLKELDTHNVCLIPKDHAMFVKVDDTIAKEETTNDNITPNDDNSKARFIMKGNFEILSHTILKGGDDVSGDLIIGGYASTDSIDADGEIIDQEALRKAFIKYMSKPEFANINLMHGNLQAGQPLLDIEINGKIHKTHFDQNGLYLISRIRDDDLESIKKLRRQILNGEIRGYSIGGEGLEFKREKGNNGRIVNKITKLDLWEVTLCPKGKNPDAKFDILTSNAS